MNINVVVMCPDCFFPMVPLHEFFWPRRLHVIGCAQCARLAACQELDEWPEEDAGILFGLLYHGTMTEVADGDGIELIWTGEGFVYQ